MFKKGSIASGGLGIMVVSALLVSSQTASAQVYSRSCGAYNNAPVTYVSYQPTQYRPVYTDRQVVYTAPAPARRIVYVDPAPVREVVRYIPRPAQTSRVYIEPEYNYDPSVITYSPGHRYHGHRYYGRHYYGRHYYGRHHHGYSSIYRGLRHLGRVFRHHGHHRSHGFHLSVGRLRVGGHRSHGGRHHHR